MNCPSCGADHFSTPGGGRATPTGGRSCPYEGAPYAGLRAGHDQIYFGRWRGMDANSIDYDTALPILAIDGDRVVGSATLYRNGTGWKQRIGIVRILIAPEYRHLGLGTAMIREIRHLGEKVALNYLLAEVIEEQQAAVRALERMGFERAVVHRNFVNDRKGDLHNLVVLLHPMSGLKK